MEHPWARPSRLPPDVMLSLLLVLAAPSYAPQAPNVRAPAQLGTSVGYSFAMDSDADLTVALFSEDGNGDQAFVRTSDGRGLSWTAPLVLHPGPAGARHAASPAAVRVVGATAFALWTEPLNPSYLRELRFARSKEGARIWSPPHTLDKGRPEGIGQVRGTALAVSADAQGNHVYVLSRVSLAPCSTLACLESYAEDLYLTASHDGGATFAAAVPVSTREGTGVDVDSMAIEANGWTVDVVWLDDRLAGALEASGGTNDVYHRRSLDGGATWMRAEVELDAPGASGIGASELHVEAVRDDVVVLWREERTSSGKPELRAARSADGGESFGVDRRIGAYTGGVDYVGPSAMVEQGGVLIAVWSDAREGVRDLYSARSIDGGETWEDDVALSVPGVGFRYDVSMAGEGADVGVVARSDLVEIWSAFSSDLGASWTGHLLERSPWLMRTSPAIAFNARYRNFVHLWTNAPGGGTDDLWSGGYRPQTLVPRGFSSARSSGSFELAHFPGAASDGTLAAVLLSRSLGSFLLPGDGRDVGLAPDELFWFSVGERAGRLGMVLTEGSGTTPPLELPLAGSTSFFAAGLSFHPRSEVFGHLTDPVRVSVR